MGRAATRPRCGRSLALTLIVVFVLAGITAMHALTANHMLPSTAAGARQGAASTMPGGAGADGQAPMAQSMGALVATLAGVDIVSASPSDSGDHAMAACVAVLSGSLLLLLVAVGAHRRTTPLTGDRQPGRGFVVLGRRPRPPTLSLSQLGLLRT